MKHFRLSLVELLIGVSLFFTIERLDFGQQNIVDIHSFVYVLGIVAVLSIILVPTFSQVTLSRLILLWLVIFIICKLVLSSERSILGGIYTYLTLTEAAFLLILVWLAYQVARDYHDFQQAVAFMALADSGRHLLKIEEAGPEIRREMTRSRHFHHPLSVIVVKPEKQRLVEAVPHLVEEVLQNVAEKWTAVRLSDVIKEQLRVVDMVLEDQENGRFIILCPEIEAQGTHVLTDRISKALVDQLNVRVAFGTASFPQQSLTFESLLTVAESQLKPLEPAAEAKVRLTQQEAV